MPRLGAVTIGQSPRTDIIPDLRTVLGAEVEIVEAGALDELAPDEIRALASGGAVTGVIDILFQVSAAPSRWRRPESAISLLLIPLASSRRGEPACPPRAHI